MKNRSVKISRRAARNILLLLIVVAIGGYVFLGVTYNSDKSEKDDLKDEIAQKEPLMEQLEKKRGGSNIEALIEEAEAELEAQEARIPASMGRLEVAEALMGLVDEAGLNISQSQIVSSVSDPRVEEIEGREYYAVTFQLTVSGSYRQVIDFIGTLESGDMENVSIGYVILTQKGGSWAAPVQGVFYSRVEVPEDDSTSSNSTE